MTLSFIVAGGISRTFSLAASKDGLAFLKRCDSVFVSGVLTEEDRAFFLGYYGVTDDELKILREYPQQAVLKCSKKNGNNMFILQDMAKSPRNTEKSALSDELADKFGDMLCSVNEIPG